ncbi:Gfo/Idh/MocA family protein [Nocardia asiatica]|uniref:Gfo/Idh/MocA family protein n=1 Tax=Nocardia asiatica TaxID=209252 RepID=UPI0024537C41|nr:Gfo/Idh/MocA family oxidoreductase [Nocardia asiatica]
MSLQIGLVGAGLAARSHALDIVTDPAMDLAGVAAARHSSAAAIAEDFGSAAYPDVDSMVHAGVLDAVVVAVPPRAVFDVLEGLPATLPCLVEKPVAPTSSELSRLRRLSGERPYWVAPFNRRYQPHIRESAELVAQGAIGSLCRIEARWTGPYATRYAHTAPTYRASAGPRHGVLIDNGSHALDVIAMFLPAEVPAPTPNTITAVFGRNERGADVEADLCFRAGAVEVRLVLADAEEGPGCGDWQIALEADQGAALLNESGCTFDAPEPTVIAPEPMLRPVTDLHRIAIGEPPMGSRLSDVEQISVLVTAAYDHAERSTSRWIRPRGKALGRLNGAC